ncbi:MAG: hypothetical protein SFY56_11040 [Bacteroidota bacterium]|nr:hypothetical protein [Bacteroidota bacterium]
MISKKIDSITKYQKFLFATFIFVFFSCHKDNGSKCPPLSTLTVPAFYRQFNFKPSSFWVFKNTISNVIDTLKVTQSKGYEIKNGISTSHDVCGSSTNYESYTTQLTHKIFPNGESKIVFHSDDQQFLFVDGSNQTLGIIQKNSGDSIIYNNNFYIKLENIYSTLSANSSTFNNVYQMYYKYPSSAGFRRIWWCPNIGLIKFEFLNQTTSQTEIWELQNYNVQLY